MQTNQKAQTNQKDTKHVADVLPDSALIAVTDSAAITKFSPTIHIGCAATENVGYGARKTGAK